MGGTGRGHMGDDADERGPGELGKGGHGRGGKKSVNPPLGVSVWQVFMPLCSEHLHYALNT